MDSRPGRIEFMSSQRRESRWRHINCANREGADGRVCPAPVTRLSHASASDETTRSNVSASLVTNSLQKDFRTARLACKDVRRSSRGTHKTGSLRRTQAGPVGPARSSLLPISFLTGSARFHLALPQAPVGEGHWAERYDGKGNLHFKHAA